jgi:hypothetical protein
MDTLGYLDAGSGSMIVQMIVGGLAAVGVTMRVYWSRVKRLFKRGPGEPEQPAEH